MAERETSRLPALEGFCIAKKEKEKPVVFVFC